jgi:nickel-dependent lactate racemase
MNKKKELRMDYWDKKIPISVPQDTIVPEVSVFPTYKDPLAEVKKALDTPFGAPPLYELAKNGKGGKVVIAHDDPSRPALPRRIIIALIMEILNEAGINDENVFLLSAGGNHPKWPDTHLKNYYGNEIYNRFRPLGSHSRILSHDCHDLSGLKYMGISELGDYVEFNILLEEADLFIYCGQIIPNNWGGYTGTGVVGGLGSARSIVSTHGFPVVNHKESCHGDPEKMLYRNHKQAIMAQIEKATGKRVFYVDAILGEGAEIAHVFAGYSPELNEPTWDTCDNLFTVEVPQADVFIVGLPRFVTYGETSNPLISLAFACTPPRIWRNKHLLRDGGVVIALTRCTGLMDSRAHPSYSEVLQLYRGCHSCRDLMKYEEEFLHREDLIFKYRFCHGYAPLHPFWLLYESEYILNRASKVIFAGVPSTEVHNAPPQVEGPGGPGAVRDMGCIPTVNFDDAWKMAEKIVGKNPVVVACPDFWSTPFRPLFHVI